MAQTSAAAAFNGALLVMHSPVDNTVGVEHAGVIFRAARHPKSFVTLDFVCYQCHTDENGVGGNNSMKTMAELSAKAVGIHN